MFPAFFSSSFLMFWSRYHYIPQITKWYQNPIIFAFSCCDTLPHALEISNACKPIQIAYGAYSSKLTAAKSHDVCCWVINHES